MAFISTKRGKQYTDQILRLIDSIRQEETALLKIQQQTNKRSVDAFNVLTAILFVLLDLFTILLLIIVGYQILTNLINNAIKFSESGNIDFCYDLQTDVIKYYVMDTGIGIHPDLFDPIFLHFTLYADCTCFLTRFTRLISGS